jgi:hypothetical protein
MVGTSKASTYAQVATASSAQKTEDKTSSTKTNAEKNEKTKDSNSVVSSGKDGKSNKTIGSVSKDLDRLAKVIEDAHAKALNCTRICNDILEHEKTLSKNTMEIKKLQKMLNPYKTITLVDPANKVQQLRITYHFPADKGAYQYKDDHLPPWTIQYEIGNLSVEDVLKRVAPMNRPDFFRYEIINQLMLMVHFFNHGFGPKPSVQLTDMFYYLVQVQKGAKHAPHGSLMSISEAWTAPYLARVIQQEEKQTLFVDCTVKTCVPAEGLPPIFPVVFDYLKTAWGKYSPNITQNFSLFLGAGPESPAYSIGTFSTERTNLLHGIDSALQEVLDEQKKSKALQQDSSEQITKAGCDTMRTLPKDVKAHPPPPDEAEDTADTISEDDHSGEVTDRDPMLAFIDVHASDSDDDLKVTNVIRTTPEPNPNESKSDDGYFADLHLDSTDFPLDIEKVLDDSNDPPLNVDEATEKVLMKTLE